MIKHLEGLEINSIYDFDNAFSINELLCKFWEKIQAKDRHYNTLLRLKVTIS